MPHTLTADYQCPVCKETVRPEIPHECNYNICHKCRGQGMIGWRSQERCDWCQGTGEWVNAK